MLPISTSPIATSPNHPMPSSVWSPPADLPQPTEQELEAIRNHVEGMVDLGKLLGLPRHRVVDMHQAGHPPGILPLGEGACHTDEIANQTNELRRFVQALGRGYEAARADPQGAVKALVRANPALNAKLQLASVRATLR